MHSSITKDHIALSGKLKPAYSKIMPVVIAVVVALVAYLIMKDPLWLIMAVPAFVIAVILIYTGFTYYLLLNTSSFLIQKKFFGIAYQSLSIDHSSIEKSPQELLFRSSKSTHLLKVVTITESTRSILKVVEDTGKTVIIDGDESGNLLGFMLKWLSRPV